MTIQAPLWIALCFYFFFGCFFFSLIKTFIEYGKLSGFDFERTQEKKTKRVRRWSIACSLVSGVLTFVFVMIFCAYAGGTPKNLKDKVDTEFISDQPNFITLHEEGSLLFLRQPARDIKYSRAYFWNRVPKYLPHRFTVLDLHHNTDSLQLFDLEKNIIVPMVE